MAKPRFPGKPHRLLSRNRTRISTYSAPHDDDTLDVIGNICLGLGIFKHNFPGNEEHHLPGCNDFKGFTAREVSASKIHAKRRHEEANKRDFKHSSPSSLLSTPLPLIVTPTIEGPKNEVEELNDEGIGVPSSKRARRKGGGRKPFSLTPKQENPTEETEIVPEIKQEPSLAPVTNVSMLPAVESPLSWVGHPLIVEGKRRWKPTYKVLQGPSLLEESRRLGGEAWPLGARQMGRAVEAPAPLGGKFVTGSGEKEQESKNNWKSCASSSGVRPSGGGILREARLRLDSAASGSEDGEWVRRMMDDTDKSKSLSESPKPSSQSSALEGGSPDKTAQESEVSRVYCRICRGAMSRRFSKRKMGKRGVWSCKACREFAAEMTKKLRNNKNADGSHEEPATVLVCRGGKGKCPEEENWPPAPPQRCVSCWLRLCLNAPPPHLVPCPVSRAALRKQLPGHGAQPTKEPGRRGKKRRGSKFVHLKGKRQKVAAEGPRVKHVCRSALAVLGRPPATFPAREPLKTQGGEASNDQEGSAGGEVNEAEGSAKKQQGGDKPSEEGDEASSPPPALNASGGAHQWWKQRNRRRKKGRLSLVLPRHDGRLPLQRHLPKTPPTIKPPAVVKVSKDLGPPLQLEGYPFRADAAEVFTNGYGVIQVAPNIMPVQPVCFLCGSGGKQWLVHCALCCEPFHTFCVEWAGWDTFDGWDVPSTGPPKGFRPLEWMCRRCSLCHACGLPAYVPGGGMPSVSSRKKVKDAKAIENEGDKKKKKDEDDEDEEGAEDMGTRTCNICHRCYHGVCLGSSTENQKNNDLAHFQDKDTPWVCSSCLRCHSCGKTTVFGSVPKKCPESTKEGDDGADQSGPEDLLMCAQCLSLHRKGNYCPLCHVVYRDSDFDALMMQCAQCSSWVHASCEGLSDDQYHLLSLLPSSIEFTCSPCTSTPHPAWRKAMQKKLRHGLERILEFLVDAVNARKSSSLPPPLPLCAPADPSICYSDIPTDSFQRQFENQSKNLDKGDSSDEDLSNKYCCQNDTFVSKSTITEPMSVEYRNSGKSDVDNEGNTKVSVTDKSGTHTSAETAKILHDLKKRVVCGDFGDPSDFYKAVEYIFPSDELVLSTLHGALSKVFPSVKTKYFPVEMKKKLEVLQTDHCYTFASKTSDLLKTLPKVKDEENYTKNLTSEENNVNNTASCDLKNNVEESEKVSDKNSTLKDLGENTCKSKERSTQNENLWMDPSDYIPNLKVYSFASALRRRSRNNTVLRLSTKDFEQKRKPSNSHTEKDMTLENSKNIVTYKSVLAGIKKECSENDAAANVKEEPATEKIKSLEVSQEIPISQDQQTVAVDAKLDPVEGDTAKCSSVVIEKDDHKTVLNNISIPEVGNVQSELNNSKEKQKEDAGAVLQNSSMHSIGGEGEGRPGADGRRCLFCHVRGDADVEREGRLLLATSFGDWVHCNCALWSAEVFEEKGGLLMKVREAVNRGRRVRCALCRETGATLGCCLRGCPDSFHLGCALRSGCLLLEDKSVYCQNHIPTDKVKENNVEMSLKRPVQVDTEGRKGSVLWRWKKPGRVKKKPGENGTTFAAGSLRFTVGSLHVESLGKIVPGNVQGQFIRPPEGRNKSNNEGEMRWCEGGVSLAKKEEDENKVPEMMAFGGPVIVPVGFRCTRLYWSSVEPWKVIEYHIQTVVVISETFEAELPVNEEKEESLNEEHDLHAHVTVDHTAEAEDEVRSSGEQTDLIVSPDLNDEILKDLPSDFFSNKKLVHSIFVGLLKGSNNGDIQNGFSHSTLEDVEEGKLQKNHCDKEHPNSPISLSDQNIQVPRHNKPINVVQPVSKETLLTTETASRAWELTCEMRAAQTPPPSASPTMTGAAGNTSEITLMKPQNKPAIWSEGSKELWKHMRPIPQLDGNADPSSSSSEGGGSSPVRSSPGREADQALPCLLACRIKQQSLARSEPGGGGPVKCNECRRTYRTREGYERHLCGTPLPLSSTSSDSDSEDRTSRRVSSESDVPNISEDMVPQANDTDECFNEFSEKDKTSNEMVNSKKNGDHNHLVMESSALGKDSPIERISPLPNDVVSSNHSALNTPESCPSIRGVTANFDGNSNKNGAFPCDETQTFMTNCLPSNQPKELQNHLGEKETVNPCETEDPTANNSTNSVTMDHNSPSNVCSQKLAKNRGKNVIGGLSTKEVREGVWKGTAVDGCMSKSTKRQTAMVQPLCYVNGKRRVPSGEALEVSKAARLAMSQEESVICNNQQISQGGIPQTSIITAPIQSQAGSNFQVLVRQLPSSSAVPQFAENFRQQTGHTLQYLATIDPATFNQPSPLTQSQSLVGLIQGTPQLMQTQTLMSSQQIVASSPIMLAPQQQALLYNPVTACLEALPPQQQNYILTSSGYTIPVSTPLSYGITQEMPQVYFQSTPQLTAPPQLEPVVHNEVGWSLPPGYQIVQNQAVEQPPQTMVIQSQPLPQMISSNVPPVVEEDSLSGSATQMPTVPVQSSPSLSAKKKRILLPNNKVREGYMAYRRDERTGKYIPVEEGWEESLGLPLQNKVNEEGCLRSGLSPAVFPAEGKDCSAKDGKRRPISRKVDGATVQVAESVENQGGSRRWVRAVMTSQFRMPSNRVNDPVEQIPDPRNPIYVGNDRTHSALEQVSLSTERVPKRVESASVMYQVHSADGLTIQSDTPDKMWDQVFNTVQEARVAHGLTPLPRNPFAPMSGSKPFMGAETLALSHKGLRYLLKQLPGASQLLETKKSASEVPSVAPPPHKLFSRAHLSLSTQTPAAEAPSIPPPPSSPPLPENPTGCARTEAYQIPPPLPNLPGGQCPSLGSRKWRHRDIFGWLASPHRKLPMAPLPTQDSEPNGGGNRRATSLDLPMAMRFRHLKETSRETVGVYRSHIHGRGLFCLKDIEAGEMVIEYSGEVIRSSLTDTREKTYEAKGMGCYMFRIDEQTVVDATMRGNAARFINHSCDPNCYSRVVDILGKKHILIFALRRIPRGEELTYDYKFPFEDVKIPCHCSSKRCRKYLN